MSKHPSVRYAESPPPELAEAVRTYRDFWARLRMQEHDFPANFDGSKGDLDALGYCVYEIGFPESDYRHASLIWAQAIVNLTEMSWLEPIAGQIAIGGPGDGPGELAFFPHARLLELVAGHYSQDETFSELTAALLLQALCAGYGLEDLPRLSELSFAEAAISGSSHFDCLAVHSRHLRRGARRARRECLKEHFEKLREKYQHPGDSDLLS
ncbi:hypothetical protein [Haloferula sp. BvORR071]|uniref:hypothetical protein n=1 Tax=Haloferula sp. BvORR071 TaxID=1396141 RepID=UPI00055173A3|nr:hypothetical protein [Haloferula sp. BvORR071]